MGRTDKLPSIPPKDSTLDVYVLNDESWETFLFAMYSADNKPQDQQSAKAGNGIRWGNLYEGLNSGYRAKFSVLDKNELVAWVLRIMTDEKAVDNQKAYDICKDTKSYVDSSEPVPDVLMAKLIKLWLLLSRAEGLDVKFGKSDEATEKGSRKEDRAKTPLLVKKPNSVKTPPVKSDPKGNDSNSQRKDKLRDRVGGKTEKVQAVGDEPADGPDMYYALKDFDSVGVFSILQEQHSIQINSIITLLESNKTVEGSTNATFLALKKECENAPDSSLWKNTLWTHLENVETTDVKELQDKIAAKIYSILEQRKVYEKYYGTESYLEIPVIEDPKELRGGLRFYTSLLNAIGNQKTVTEDLILAVAVEEVRRSKAFSDEKSQEESLIPEEASDISKYLGNAIKKLAVTLKTGDNNILKSSPGKSPKIIQYGDEHTFAIQEANASPLFDLNLEKLFLSIQSKFSMKKIQNAVSHALRKGLEDGLAAHRERILIQTEFKRFSDLPDEIIQRCLLQLDFENILSKKLGKEISIQLNDWCWKEHFDKISLVQVLQNAKWMCPNISTWICPREGSMLVTMMGSGDPFALKSISHYHFTVNSKVGLNLFTKLNETNPNALISSPDSVGYLAGDSISSFDQELTTLYPDNGAKIEISKWNTRASQKVTGLYAGRDMTLSWSFEDKVSKVPYATLRLRDGTVLSVKKSNGSTSITLSTSEGLVIDFLPGKKLCQRLAGFESINKEVSEVELSRMIHSDGSVIRYLDGNLLQILQPNSSVITKQKDGLWIAVNPEGLKTSINAAKKVKTENINMLNENNPEIRKRTIEREDLVSIIIEHNNAVLYFPDGTKMKVGCKGSESKLVDELGNYRLRGPFSISIEKHGLATVSFESEKDYQSLILPNNVTVKRGTKSDGKTTENYLFLEQGIYSCEVDSFGTFKINERITTGKNTTYKTLLKLNWITGEFDLQDNSGNSFKISSSGESTVNQAEARPRIYAKSMNLPVGKNLAALVQGTIELPSRISGNIPRFFMIRQDGSGIELLRDETVAEYFRDLLKNEQVDVIEEVLPDHHNGISLITIQPLNFNTLMYRHLARFSPMTPEIRKKINESLGKYESWKNVQETNSAKYIKFSVTNEKLAISSSLSDVTDKTKEPYLNAFKNELEAKILKKYVPGEIIARKSTITDNHSSNLRRESIWTKPRLSKIFDKGLSDQIQKLRKTSMILPHKIIKNPSDIPCYFNSPEGKSFSPPPVSKVINTIKENPTKDCLSPEMQEAPASAYFVQKESSDTFSELQNPETNVDEKIETAPKVEGSLRSVKEEKIPYDPLKVDVFGTPRSQKVPLPNAIKMAKPGAVPNEKFLKIESQTKRTTKTVSAVPFAKKGGTFEVLPSKAKFGTIREGYIYQTVISLVNVGIDSTRFRIKSPKSKRISLNYRKGPVAPGIKLALEIIIDARELDSDQPYKISEEIEIVSESEYLYVPVSAEIHPADSPEVQKLRPHISILTDSIIQV